MALDIILQKFHSETAGEVTGFCIQKGREKSIEVHSFSHTINAPRDMATGQASGKRQHKPITFQAIYGMELPLMHQILCDNSTIKEMIFDFYSPREFGIAGGGHGKEIKSYTITLTHAHIVELTTRTLNVKNPDLQKYETFYECSVVYEQIKWDWHNHTPKSAEDSWIKGSL